MSRAAVSLLDAAGKDLILVETVGVGQTELDIMELADLVVVVLVPEAGDSVQAMKAGLLEIADVFVINKSDRDGAGQLASAIRGMISLDPRPPEQTPQVLLTEAHTGKGIDHLYTLIGSWGKRDMASGQAAQRRSEQSRQEVARLLTAYLAEAVDAMLSSDDRASALMSEVASGDLDPHSAAQGMLDTGLVTAALNTLRFRDMGETRAYDGCVVGIDITSHERKPTACAVLDSKGALIDLGKKKTDEDIIQLVREYAPTVVAIDSPLGYPKGMDCLEESHDCESVHCFSGRKCEREIARHGIGIFWTTKRTFIKDMIYRAIALAKEIRSLGIEVIEVYPHASKVFLFGIPIPKKTTREGKRFMTAKLIELIPGLADSDQRLDHDLMDALVAAHTAHLNRLKRTKTLGIPEEAQIHVPDPVYISAIREAF